MCRTHTATSKKGLQLHIVPRIARHYRHVGTVKVEALSRVASARNVGQYDHGRRIVQGIVEASDVYFLATRSVDEIDAREAALDGASHVVYAVHQREGRLEPLRH